GDPELEVVSYRASLRELDSCEEMEEVVKYMEAEPLYERSQAMQEKVLGLEH
ncbi:unnamed protein product, partial [Ectocarpus sp. 13 AM-2016]